MTIGTNHEATRLATMAHVIAQALTEDERKDLIATTLKPLFEETKDSIGRKSDSAFTKAVERALNKWAEELVYKHCNQPEVYEKHKKAIADQCDKILEEHLPEVVAAMIKVPSRF